MNEKIKKRLELHSKGATVIHRNPFENLEHFDNGYELSKEFIDKWVIPFYMADINDKEAYINLLKTVKAELKPNIIKQLLGDFNWRTRSTGATFATLLDLNKFEEIIGIHLLKSQVCYAGQHYSLALASFNTPNSINYLEKYLEYYLQRNELYFDQNSAMAALIYLDKKNNTGNAKKFQPLWDNFVVNKPHWDLNTTIKHFNHHMKLIEAIKSDW